MSGEDLIFERVAVCSKEIAIIKETNSFDRLS